MYRPNRVGPWPLVTLESSVITSGLFTSSLLGTVPQCNVSSAIGNESTIAEQWILGDIAIPAGEHGAIGVKVSGSQLESNKEFGEFLVAYGGAFQGFTSDEAVSIRCMLGRASTPGIVGFSCPQFAYVPSVISNHERTSGAEVSSVVGDANGEVVIGDWAPEGAFLENEIFFGWLIANGGSAVANVSDIQMAASLHRYVSDLHPFDPNR